MPSHHRASLEPPPRAAADDLAAAFALANSEERRDERQILGLIGILAQPGPTPFCALRGFTLLLAAPGAAIVAAAFSGEPILAKWTLTFMQGAGGLQVTVSSSFSCSAACSAN